MVRSCTYHTILLEFLGIAANLNMANKEVIILQPEDGKFKGKVKELIDGIFPLIRAEVE